MKRSMSEIAGLELTHFIVGKRLKSLRTSITNRATSSTKARFEWTTGLDQRFQESLEHLGGIDEAKTSATLEVSTRLSRQCYPILYSEYQWLAVAAIVQPRTMVFTCDACAARVHFISRVQLMSRNMGDKLDKEQKSAFWLSSRRLIASHWKRQANANNSNGQ